MLSATDAMTNSMVFLSCQNMFLLILLLLFPGAYTWTPEVRINSAGKVSTTVVDANKYVTHWENLLIAEHQEATTDLQIRRKTWSRSRLESSGLSVFGACAEPESDLYGEKIVRIYKPGETRFRDRFAPGEMLVLTAVGRMQRQVPRECIIVDVDKDWMTVGVGPTWPAGLWDARRIPGSYEVRLDRAAPQAPLRAQRICLELIRKNKAGEAAALMAHLFNSTADLSESLTSQIPSRFMQSAYVDASDLELDDAVSAALEKAKSSCSFQPNQCQEEAITSALKRRISLIRGPPGTGKTRVAALLVKTALALCDSDGVPPRVLVVAHSNGAADVLLEALLQLGVPAIRVGRPASVSPSVRHRTVVAMAEKHPEVVSLRQRARDVKVESHVRYAAATEVRQCVEQVQQLIAKTAPVVVTSCIGAYQLLDLDNESANNDMAFPLVVLDEASQTTEPALLCALAASRAEQIVLVGDTRQLPPTVTSETPELREKLGVSPMERLEKLGVQQNTLRLQYRMAPVLLEHPSQYFYNGLVSCANKLFHEETPPRGFMWPGLKPLAFIQLGSDLEVAHDFGGRSNPTEAELVVDIVSDLLAEGDVKSDDIAVISPYSKQVQRIHTALSTRRTSQNVDDVRVGTVDSFQGQETDVVVFSAVRSNPIGEMGFLRDPRRLCVALTRARRGLILVGDQAVLRTCKHWSALLDSCKARGCFVNAKDMEN